MMTLMKPVVLYVRSASILSSSCKDARKTTFVSKESLSFEEQYKEIYVDQFKLTYFRKLLTKSYNGSDAIREIINKDNSGFTEPILTEADEILIDSLASMDNQILIADSANGHRRAEGAQGKRPLGHIMEKLSSKWLDSLAKQRLNLISVPSSWTD